MGSTADRPLLLCIESDPAVRRILEASGRDRFRFHFAEGMSTSVKTAIQNLPDEIDGALFMLAGFLAALPRVLRHKVSSQKVRRVYRARSVRARGIPVQSPRLPQPVPGRAH